MSKFLDLTGLQSVVNKIKALLAEKQDILTTGDNIDITNDVISVIGKTITEITASSIQIADLDAGVYQIPEGAQIYYDPGVSSSKYTTISKGILIVDSKSGSMINKAWYLFDGDTSNGRKIVYGYVQGNVGGYDSRNLATIESSTNKVTSLSSSSTNTQYPSAKAVYNAIQELPEPMVFKGSLGTGGTITELPAASSSNEGHTYKVITAGTYAGQAAKIGDTFISDGTAWVLIPSGDEPSGTVTSITIQGTSPIVSSSSSAITTSGTRTISHATSGVSAGTYKSVTVNTYGHVTAGTNPTTLAGYGITDAASTTDLNGKVSKTGDTMTGALAIRNASDSSLTLANADGSKSVKLNFDSSLNRLEFNFV